MIAFTAEWDSGEIVVDPAELSDARWFAADALPMIPPPVSIARRPIDAWVAQVTPRAEVAEGGTSRSPAVLLRDAGASRESALSSER